MRHLPPSLRRHLSALRMLLVFTVLTGVAYPLAVTGIAQLAFRDAANGSLVEEDGRPVASALLGQSFALPKRNPRDAAERLRPDPRWFQPRPSAGDYDARASGPSNLGPNNPVLIVSVEERRAAAAVLDGVPPASVPVDALTASGSGLDPDISPAYAREQAPRVARARGLPVRRVEELVAAHVEGRFLGFLGGERVNVVALNRDLRRLR
ncbi:potassium-transporting ATPase subunit KdpC [Streptomyces sp. AV19]|uniref:potassium-transporting ATPase subunit KdpC n=1 Tax=Streptomyces sp. AV19 TaxID=2793068 RepID=UPI0018FE4382|nr:potassium-transporting ATPase subunit KdpC [Streptomyces sp. AV19]MBH1937586.1 potassium-transporting ATPase subunit KdpC [Streptomyces sp. AV19]MDG4533601.1 potassium-transporting ATPase subunit KdpC [Streptomyces sp. AV19]